MNSVKYFFYLFIFSSIVACSSVKHNNIEGYIGLYEIVKAECEIEKGAFDPCENTCFFEVLKGQFIGVNDNDLAYVFWSGYPEIDSDLQYTAHPIDSRNTKKITEKKLWLSKDKGIQEYLTFHDRVLIEYYVEYRDRGGVRKIKYTLNPVRRGGKPSFRMNYPGNK
ncbi:MAG: hypothetical protein KUG83_00245 [Gammaproteobacteria bacterium]|nr:hypothetical protein [Gammaproteobacteria bacterium]